MSYGSLKIETGGQYLRIKEGQPADIHVLTKSDDVVHRFVHIYQGGKRIECVKGACSSCQEGHKPKETWTISVYHWNDRKVKTYEFGVMVCNGIKAIATMLEEMGQTIHDIDLRIMATGQGQATKYQVLQKPMKEALPPNLDIPKIAEEIPF